MLMGPPDEFRENSQAVQAHLGITQSVIQRMAANSASCKAWCIALVSAILVIAADKEKPQYTPIAIVPVALFLVLDAYYLALERAFRISYNAFIERLHTKKLTVYDLYSVMPGGNIIALFFRSLASFSIWPFYLTLLALAFLTRSLV